MTARVASPALLERPIGSRKLRHLVELKGDEQRVFFRWVSWAYRKIGFSEDGMVDVIVKAVDPQMQQAIRGAEQALHHPIRVEGMNPRPQKDATYRYQLGTLSEHATGRAIDIDPGRNPILSKHTWDAILRATKQHVDLRLEHWSARPADYFDAIARVDDLWSRMVGDKVTARRLKRAYPDAFEAGDLTRPAGVIPRLELGRTALLDDVAVIQELLGPAAREDAAMLAVLPRYHFLGHARDLVLALRAQGLRWGASFYPRNIDLHHFELPQAPLPAVE